MPLMWSLSDHTLRWAGVSGEIKQSMVFMLYTSVVSAVIGLPWSLYSTFAVEQRHGFNKQVGRDVAGERPVHVWMHMWGKGYVVHA